MPRASLAALSSALVLAACATPTAPDKKLPPATDATPSVYSKEPSVARVTLLHLSDTEAGIRADDDGTGGIARARAILDALTLRAAHPLVLHAGDTLVPSPELSLDLDGKSAITIANAKLGVAAYALGNHELDLGEAFFADVAKSAGAPILTCTLDVKGGPLAELVAGASATTPWADELKGKLAPRAKVCAGKRTATGCDGVTVGVIGATTEQLRSITKGASENLVLPPSRDEVLARIAVQVSALESEGITTIVLLSHLQGVEHDLDLVKRGLTGVDVIVSAGGENRLATPRHRLVVGDEPDRVCRRVDGDCYPIAQRAADGAPVLIVAVGGAMRYLGHLVFDVDAAGRLTGIQPQSRPVPVDETTLLELSAPIDRELLAFEQRVHKELLPLLEVVGHTSVYLEGSREKVRNRETNLGDVSADAILATARAWAPNPKPTFALRNAGALRASIGSVDPRTSDKGGGDITQLAVKSALRFDSKIVTLTITHAALRDTLEASLIGAGSARGHFPQVSAGVELEYATKPRALVPKTDAGKVTGVLCPGRRIQRLVVPGAHGPVVVVEDGETRTPKATLTLATIDYLSSGGDGWFPGQKLAPVPVMTPEGAPATDQAAFLAFVKQPSWNDGAAYVDPRDNASGARIRQVIVLEDDDDGCAAAVTAAPR